MQEEREERHRQKSLGGILPTSTLITSAKDDGSQTVMKKPPHLDLHEAMRMREYRVDIIR